MLYNLTVDETTTREEQLKERIKWREREITKILEYATEKYKVTFSKDFAKKMSKSDKCDKSWVPSKNVVDALVEEWKIWKPYVDGKSFSFFIQDGLKSILEIKGTATSYVPEFNSFIGNKATVIKQLPLMATCITSKGVLLKDGKRI